MLPSNKGLKMTDTHFVNGNSLTSTPAGMETALFGMGCFWGVERIFWQIPGVWVTSVGYAGGHTAAPNYEQVCTGATDHNEVVQVVFDPAVVSYDQLLQVFWEGHNPTQGMRQGNDRGSQYRSGIYCSEAQLPLAEASRDRFQMQLTKGGFGAITTEISPAPKYFMAEGYHQQYLAKNPAGYCGIGGTGIKCG